MTDLLEEAKTALGMLDDMTPFSGIAEQERLNQMAPDMARALIAVEAWLIAEIEACEALGHKANAEQCYRALAAFRAIVEGRTND
jgi:hypothetical protein